MARLSSNLDDPSSRPCFLWSENATVAELRGILANRDDDRRPAYMARLMREASIPELWKFLTPGDVAVPGELLVGRDPGAALPVFEDAAVVQTLPLARSYDLVRVRPGREAEATAFYQAAQGVRSVAPNLYLEPHATPPPTNDPLLPYNWQYDAKRADVYGAWGEVDLVAQAALANVTVAIVDSGVDAGHPDLTPGVVSGFLTTPTLDKTTPPAGASFDQNADDHGTRVAGVIGASKGNGLGGAGIAPGCKILPLKDLDPASGRITTAGLLNAITIGAYYNQADSPFTWLRSTGNGQPVSVINISQGVPGSFGVQAAYQDAIETAVAHGIAVVVSTGNENTDVTVPANTPAAIGVGVTMRYLDWEFIALYSNHGDAVFVTAPGNMIWSTGKSNGGDYARAYKLFNGTSAAAPFTSGVLALMYAKYSAGQTRNRALVERMKAKLKSSADDLGPAGWDALYGWGRVNARKSIFGAL
jgi:subtilisin family serine protease